MRFTATRYRRSYDSDFEQRQADMRAFRRTLHRNDLTLVKRPERDEYALYWIPVCKENFIYESVIEDVIEYFHSMELGA